MVEYETEEGREYSEEKKIGGRQNEAIVTKEYCEPRRNWSEKNARRMISNSYPVTK